MRKLVIILILLALVGCTVSLVLVKNSEDVEVTQGAEGTLDGGVDIKLKPKDTIK